MVGLGEGAVRRAWRASSHYEPLGAGPSHLLRGAWNRPPSSTSSAHSHDHPVCLSREQRAFPFSFSFVVCDCSLRQSVTMPVSSGSLSWRGNGVADDELIVIVMRCDTMRQWHRCIHTNSPRPTTPSSITTRRSRRAGSLATSPCCRCAPRPAAPPTRSPSRTRRCRPTRRPTRTARATISWTR